MEPEEAALWKRQVRGLSALLAAPVCETVPDAPARIGYHQPCHWGEDDPDLPFLRQAFPLIMKGTGLCCGMGGILKMTDADVSAAMGGEASPSPFRGGGKVREASAQGNGRLDAVCNAIKAATGLDFTISTYSEHSLEHGSTSQAASYVGLAWGDGSTTWGAGTDTDIIRAGIKALVSAVNNK